MDSPSWKRAMTSTSINRGETIFCSFKVSEIARMRSRKRAAFSKAQFRRSLFHLPSEVF